jgi:hypothetical protein
LLLDVARGINQHAVEVEQNGPALESLHGCSEKAISDFARTNGEQPAITVFLTPCVTFSMTIPVFSKPELPSGEP